MTRHILAAATILAVLLPVSMASAQGFGELGQGLTPDRASQVDVHGVMRVRGAQLYNLDLDHGLTPSGQPLYPVPLDGGQRLSHADMRMRLDMSGYAPYGSVRVNARLDVFDNLMLGSTPTGVPLTTTSQRSPDTALRVRRAYGEAVTPFGLVVAGRLANTWGLGLVANAGECPDCDSADAADRVAFITTQFDHFIALAYDIGWTGASVPAKVNTRRIDLDPSDDVSTLTFAILRWRDANALKRRNDANRLTFDYGVVYSHRWQDNDVPAYYLPTSSPVPISPSQLMRRGLRAHLIDGWARLIGPTLRIELEGVISHASVEELSLLPGSRYGRTSRTTQYGLALESEFGPADSTLRAGFNLGVASGDDAYGFGAVNGPLDPPAQPGDLEGSQANPPYDRSANNFRFHPDYRVDQILFREIIGTVTDAIYARPHMRVALWDEAAGRLELRAAAIASWALYASSTPGGQQALGLELDPSLVYTSRDGFSAQLDYAVLFPFAGLDNPARGLEARAAQLVRLRLSYAF